MEAQLRHVSEVEVAAKVKHLDGVFEAFRISLFDHALNKAVQASRGRVRRGALSRPSLAERGEEKPSEQPSTIARGKVIPRQKKCVEYVYLVFLFY